MYLDYVYLRKLLLQYYLLQNNKFKYIINQLITLMLNHIFKKYNINIIIYQEQTKKIFFNYNNIILPIYNLNLLNKFIIMNNYDSFMHFIQSEQQQNCCKINNILFYIIKYNIHKYGFLIFYTDCLHYTNSNYFKYFNASMKQILLHEQNNLITVILFLLNQCKQKHQNFCTIIQNIFKIKKYFTRLLQLSENFAYLLKNKKFQPLDNISINHLIQQIFNRDILLIFNKQYKFKIHNYCNSNHSLFIHIILMKQAILNLIINAIDANKQNIESPIIISIQDNIKLPLEIYTLNNHTNKNYIKITINNQGTIITPDIIDKIFNMHFSTKGEKRGMGLFIVKKIIQQHSGFVTVDSDNISGTSFHIFLPSCNQQSCIQDNNLKVNLPSRINDNILNLYTVLIVEDELLINAIVANYLNKNKNLYILQASSVPQAIQISKQHIINLLITDYYMHHMSGLQLYYKIRNYMPDIKVIIISGINQQKKIFSHHHIQFLLKPFNLMQISSLVNNLLFQKKEQIKEPNYIICDNITKKIKIKKKLIH